MGENDLYQVLEVSRDASVEEIKKKFKKMAMKHHPDRGGNPEKFKELNEAYAILSDPSKRKQYDTFGSTTGMEMPDVGDIFENLFGSMFSFGGSGHRRSSGSGSGSSGSSKRKVTPKHLDLWVSLEEVYQGLTISYPVKRKFYRSDAKMTACPECNGSGNTVQQIQLGFMMTQTISPCTRCSGSGTQMNLSDFREENTLLSIELPMGIPEGQPILMKQKGDEIPGMETGDILFQVRYKKHPLYSLVENTCDLSCSLEITLKEFFFGFSKSLPYLHGKPIRLYHPAVPMSLRLDSLTFQKRIRDYGIKYKHHIGDLLIKIHLVISPTLVHDPAFFTLLEQHHVSEKEDGGDSFMMTDLINLSKV